MQKPQEAGFHHAQRVRASGTSPPAVGRNQQQCFRRPFVMPLSWFPQRLRKIYFPGAKQ